MWVCLKYMVQRGDLFYWPLEDDESCESCSVIVHEVPQPIPKPSKSTSQCRVSLYGRSGICRGPRASGAPRTGAKKLCCLIAEWHHGLFSQLQFYTGITAFNNSGNYRGIKQMCHSMKLYERVHEKHREHK